MYRLMQAHWVKHGPPLYIAAAAWMGYRAPAGSGNEEMIEDPELLAAALASFPGGRVVNSGRES